jgi:LPXTG-site transpeptidase (sortase) family protein
MPKRKKLLKTSNLLQFSFGIGLILIILSFLLRVHSATKLTFDASYVPSEEVVKIDYPVALFIPTHKFSLNIYSTSIENGVWEVHPDGVSRLNSVPNTILYAHNTQDRFGFLKSVKIGDTMTLSYRTGGSVKYLVTNIKTVNPKDIDVLFPEDKNAIIMYTCTGFADSQRLVVTAIPINHE